MIKKYMIFVFLVIVLLLCVGCQSKNEKLCEKSYNAYFKGIDSIKNNDYDDAIKQFDIVIKENVSSLKFKKKDLKKIKISKEEMQREYIEAFYYKADLLEKSGNNKLSITAYNNALNKDYKHEKTRTLNESDYLNRMNAHIKLGAYQDALNDIDGAKNVWTAKTKEIFMYNKIMILEKQFAWEEAKKACEEYKSIFGSDKIKDDEAFLSTR